MLLICVICFTIYIYLALNAISAFFVAPLFIWDHNTQVVNSSISFPVMGLYIDSNTFIET